MRNWHPFLADTLDADVARRRPPRRGLHRGGAPQLLELHAVSRERRRRAGVAGARRARRCRGHLRGRLARRTRCSSRPTRIACARRSHARSRAARTGAGLSPRTAFRNRWPRSIPTARSSRRRARLIAGSSAARARAYATVYQSRSGRPEDPWLGPDICDYLRQTRERTVSPRSWSSPIGFVCDHVEVLYDLDVEAADVCREVGLADGARARGQRSPAVPRHDGRRRAAVCRRYEHARPLELVAAP